MGTITFRIVDPDSRPFGDGSMLDTCIDPQFNGVFPDDRQLGIIPESKELANERIREARTNLPTSRDSRQGKGDR